MNAVRTHFESPIIGLNNSKVALNVQVFLD